jgi:hypothetical protein
VTNKLIRKELVSGPVVASDCDNAMSCGLMAVLWNFEATEVLFRQVGIKL